MSTRYVPCFCKSLNSSWLIHPLVACSTWGPNGTQIHGDNLTIVTSVEGASGTANLPRVRFCCGSVSLSAQVTLLCVMVHLLLVLRTFKWIAWHVSTSGISATVTCTLHLSTHRPLNPTTATLTEACCNVACATAPLPPPPPPPPPPPVANENLYNWWAVLR